VRAACSTLSTPDPGLPVPFVVVAFLIGRLTEKHLSLRGFWGNSGLMSTGMLIILGLGASYLALNAHTTFYETMVKGVLLSWLANMFKAGLGGPVQPPLSCQRLTREVGHNGHHLAGHSCFRIKGKDFSLSTDPFDATLKYAGPSHRPTSLPSATLTRAQQSRRRRWQPQTGLPAR